MEVNLGWLLINEPQKFAADLKERVLTISSVFLPECKILEEPKNI